LGPSQICTLGLNTGSPRQLADGPFGRDKGPAPRLRSVKVFVSRGGEKQTDAAFSAKCPIGMRAEDDA